MEDAKHVLGATIYLNWLYEGLNNNSAIYQFHPIFIQFSSHFHPIFIQPRLVQHGFTGVEAFEHLDREIFALRGQGLGRGVGETERLTLSTRVRFPGGRDDVKSWMMVVFRWFSVVFPIFNGFPMAG